MTEPKEEKSGEQDSIFKDRRCRNEEVDAKLERRSEHFSSAKDWYLNIPIESGKKSKK